MGLIFPSRRRLAEILSRLDALEQRTFGRVRRRLTKHQLAELEGISIRQVMRRVDADVYVKPEVENKRLYWWSDTYRRVSGTAASAARGGED